MSYKQIQGFASLSNDNESTPEDTSEKLRQNFAKQLNVCVKRAYGGKSPSYAVIARDYALRAKTGDTVSAETIRKWMQGTSVPQSSRLHTLIHWLGFELAEVLQLVTEQPKIDGNYDKHLSSVAELRQTHYTKTSGEDDYLERRIFLLIQNLSKRERNMMLSILEAFRQSRDGSHE